LTSSFIFLIIGGSSYCLYNWNSQEKKDTYTLGKVSRSDIGMIVDATGTIKPVNSVKLSATASGTLEHVYVAVTAPTYNKKNNQYNHQKFSIHKNLLYLFTLRILFSHPQKVSKIPAYISIIFILSSSI